MGDVSVCTSQAAIDAKLMIVESCISQSDSPDTLVFTARPENGGSSIFRRSTESVEPVTLITKSEIPSTKSGPYCKVPVKDLVRKVQFGPD